MKESPVIKRQLLEEFQIALSREEKEPYSFPESAVVKGYAAILVSIFNYGYNVANRRPLPAEGYPGKETGMRATKLLGEQHYIRSEFNHPARDIYLKLIKVLKRDDLGLEVSKKEEIVRILEVEDKPTGPVSAGQWKIPEEVMEDLFSKIPFEKVKLICLKMVEDELQKFPAEVKKKPASSEAAGAPCALPSSFRPVVMSSEVKKRIEFKDVMLDRVETVNLLVEKLMKNKGELNLLPCVPIKTDYPCVLFDLRPLLKNLGIKYNEREKLTRQIADLNVFLMDYFCGLINYHSIKRYGKDFIWTQPQGSFGSLRPSLADTGLSFRFSPGIVPHDFFEVVNSAYQTMLSELNAPGVIDKIKSVLVDSEAGFHVFSHSFMHEDMQLYAMHSSSSKESKRAEENILLDCVNFVLKKGKEKKDMEERLKSEEKGLDLTIGEIENTLNRLKLEEAKAIHEIHQRTEKLAEKAGGHEKAQIYKDKKLQEKKARNDFQKKINLLDQELKIKKSEKVAFSKLVKRKVIEFYEEKSPEILENRSELFKAVLSSVEHKKEGSEIILPEATDTLLGLLNALVELGEQKIKGSPPKSYSLLAFENNLDKMLSEQLNAARQVLIKKDYSQVASAIETLMRILQIKYELGIINSRESRLSEKQIAEESLAMLQPPSLGSRSDSIDSVLSNQDDYATYSARSGMGALAVVYKGFHAIDEEYPARREECYFEITTNIFEIIAQQLHTSSQGGDKPERKKIYLKLDEKEVDKSKAAEEHDVRVIDIAAFPAKSVEEGGGQRSPWKSEWKSIAEKQPAILLVDVTCATQEDLEHLYQQFNRSEKEKPYLMIMFSSNNKFGEMGVDLVSMGEVKIFKKEGLEGQKKETIDKLYHHLRKAFEDVQENCTAAKAYRKLIRDLQQRPSLSKFKLLESSDSPERRKEQIDGIIQKAPEFNGLDWSQVEGDVLEDEEKEGDQDDESFDMEDEPAVTPLASAPALVSPLPVGVRREELSEGVARNPYSFLSRAGKILGHLTIEIEKKPVLLSEKDEDGEAQVRDERAAADQVQVEDEDMSSIPYFGA